MKGLIMGVIIYDPSVWTEFGLIVQRYIASGIALGVIVFAILLGIYLLVQMIRYLIGV